MKKIEVTAPISIDNLKEYFIDNEIFFVIDYKNSSLKENKLLTYLSNLDIPCDLNIEENDLYDLMVHYLNSPMLLNLETLEKKTIEILSQYKFEMENFSELNEKFIENNSFILAKWISLIESLTIYNMHTIKSDECKEFVNSFPKIKEDDFKGINFISLLKHKEFFDLIVPVDPRNLIFYEEYFNNNCFKGKSLFEYWSSEKNPLFLLTFGLTQGLIKIDENGISEIVKS
jgi:hypothetical protein